MRIDEIAPADVKDWVPVAVRHMADVRVASGALREALVPDFVAQKSALFRVGIPRDSVVLTADNGDWLWLRTGVAPEVVASSISSDAAAWRSAIRAYVDGPVAVTAFEGEQGIVDIATREVSQRLVVRVPDLHIPRGYDELHVRPMTSAELDRFLAASTVDAERQLDLAAGRDAREDWDIVGLGKGRLTDGVATPGHMMHSICLESTVVGGLWLEIDGRNARIWDVLVFPQYRGHGHSQAAIVAMSDVLSSEGVEYLHVTIMSPNKKALGLCYGVGFRVTARHLLID